MTQAPYYDPRADWSLIPDYMRGAVERYVMHGIPGGSFLNAVMSGAGITELLTCADDENQAALNGWGRFVYWHIPSPAHGSPEKVRQWIDRGGIVGRNVDPEPTPEARAEIVF